MKTILKRPTDKIILFSVVVAIFLFSVAVFAFFGSWRSADPSYHGRSLGAWLEQYRSALTSGPESGQRAEAEDAIRHIGTNALPVLIRMVRSRDSRLKELLMKWSSKQTLVKFDLTPAGEIRFQAEGGYMILGSTAEGQVLELSQILTNDPIAGVRQSVAAAIGSIGPVAESAASALLISAKDSDHQVRNNSLWALSRIQADPGLVLPGLINALDDSYSIARENAAIALGRYGPVATSAVPALVRTTPINGAAYHALLKIDPEAASRAKAN